LTFFYVQGFSVETELRKFIQDQLSVWPLAAANFRAVKRAKTRPLPLGIPGCAIQLNPCRVGSTTADVSAKAIAARPCFLCPEHRPPEQFHLKFEGRKSRCYNIQVNPYPVFPDHLVIVRDRHIPQAIWHHLPDMLDFVNRYADFAVFYNGPQCGASAPDHLHFQACPRLRLPLVGAIDAFFKTDPAPLVRLKDASLWHYPGYTTGVFALRADTPKSLTKLFYRLLECSPCRAGETEPRFNAYCWFAGGTYRACVVMRSEKRSHHYSAEGEEHLTISPGAVDMAGIFITPFREDFERATPAQIAQMLAEVSVSQEDEKKILDRLTRTQPLLDVGIVSGDRICFEIISDGAGPQQVTLESGRINYNGVLYDELVFDSITRSTLFAEPSFILYGVTIGIGFHWERKLDLKFAGSLRLRISEGKIVAVNRVGLEDYLLSVISSEMKADASLELLKAHAVISRSWVLCNLGRHEGYDVCADDHCQRYQGLTMAIGDKVRQAIDETWGQLLRYEGKICDARYSKCCGGRTERFSTCWEERDEPWLPSVPDTLPGRKEPFCHCTDRKVLAQVLNSYDIESADFFEWEVEYGVEELSELVRLKSGIDFGTLTALVPVERGASGRIKYLRIEGTKHSEVIGKELEIRRVLSPSHLRSSAFEVSWQNDRIRLKGRGWGHGVGLCQIGAAVMAEEGYSFREILAHYYPGTDVSK
jgi:SpoIID/LytB domain protein